MTNFTKDDVLAYDIGIMTDPEQRRAIESARERNPEVKRLFGLLTSDDVMEDESNDEELELSPEVLQELFASSPRTPGIEIPEAFVKLAKELAPQLLAEILMDEPATVFGAIEVGHLYATSKGMLLCEEASELSHGLGAAPSDMVSPPIVYPIIQTDYKQGVLRIRQRLNDLPNGRVEIVVVRHRKGESTAEFRIPHELEGSARYWSAVLELDRVLPECWKEGNRFWKEGDHFVYVVKAATPKPIDQEK